jgi:glutamine synthetase
MSSGSVEGRPTIPSRADELLKWIKAEHVEMVNLRVTDLNGLTRQLSVPTASVTEDLLTSGVGAGMSTYPGYRTTEASDMRMVPDLATAFLDPDTVTRTLNIVSNICEVDGSPFMRCPRGILRRSVERLCATAGSSEFMVLPELEFYIFDDVRYTTKVNQSSYVVNSDEASWNTDLDESPNLGYKFQRASGHQAAPPRDHLYEVRSDIVNKLLACGVPVRYHHHEVGGPGQGEIELLFEPAVAAGDHLQIGKDVIKAVTMRHGKTATFMPKPLFDEAGSGLHFHLRLVDGERSLFYEDGTYGCLSDSALYAIGGLLHHTPALMAICNPSTNSYRRFGLGLSAPVCLFFAVANRSAAIRIPGYGMSPKGQRIEYRMADATGNPYLTLAAITAAMADGIERRIDPREQGFGPYDINVYDLPPEELAKMKQTPTSLEQALRELQADHAFLVEGGVFDEDFVATWVGLKMRNEVGPLASRPHPYEFTMYYDR